MEGGTTSIRLLVMSVCGVMMIIGNANSQNPDSDIRMDVESGVSKIGGSHENLPPCRTDGNHIIHSNSSCIYTPPSGERQPHRNGAGRGTNRSRMSDDHGVGRGDMKGVPSPIEPSDPYDRHGRYWLVPPFLIGASSVIVLYIVGHCLYLHCYAKRKIRQLAGRATSPPAIVFSDGDGPSVSSVPSFTPVVTYDGSSSYGRTGLIDSQSFVVYQAAAESSEKYQQGLSARRPSAHRKSVHLQLPSFFKGKQQQQQQQQQQQRARSVCSESAAMETSTSSNEPAETRPDVRRTSASICLVPVCRTISDPTGGASGQQHTVEWTPVQNVVYHPSFILSNNAPIAIPAANVGRDDVNASAPFVIIQHPGASSEAVADGAASDPGEGATSKPGPSTVTSQPTTPRKTPFGRPEVVSTPLTSRPEVEAVPEVDEQS